jgi:hypothetical protein
VSRMDFSHVPEIAGASVDDYGSEGWGFESLRACHRDPCTPRGSEGSWPVDVLTFGSHPSVDVVHGDTIVVVQLLPIGWLRASHWT